MNMPWDEIKRAYAFAMPDLLAAANEDAWVDPYFLDWAEYMTPIEKLMWGHIRDQRIPFYPQFPVGPYFVDFGNPRRKIAIECDGKDYHDRVRDRKRDLALLEMGWQTVRFTGSECYRMVQLPEMLSFPFFTKNEETFGACLDHQVAA